jgi:hypothetical protein
MNILKKVFLILMVFTMFSCEKEEIVPKPDNNNYNNTNNDVDNISLLVDKDWVLVSGNFYYVEPKIYFNHPNNSFLNPFYGPVCDFDYFDIGQTTWRFTTTQFFLNGDLQSDEPNSGGINNQFIYLGIDNGVNIVNRSFEIMNITEERLEVKTGQIGSLIGNPYSVLVFRSVPTIQNTTAHVPFGYQYQGVLSTGSNNPNLSSNDLIGTRWVVTKFYNGFGFDLPNDTIDFLPNLQYSINGLTNLNRTYNVTTIIGNTSVNLNLNDFSTMGGNNYSILTSRSFIDDGIINGSQATDILNQNNSNKFIWMTRIQ